MCSRLLWVLGSCTAHSFRKLSTWSSKKLTPQRKTQGTPQRADHFFISFYHLFSRLSRDYFHNGPMREEHWRTGGQQLRFAFHLSYSRSPNPSTESLDRRAKSIVHIEYIAVRFGAHTVRPGFLSIYHLSQVTESLNPSPSSPFDFFQ